MKERIKKINFIVLLMCVFILITGCGAGKSSEKKQNTADKKSESAQNLKIEKDNVAEGKNEEVQSEADIADAAKEENGKIIVIDPGHSSVMPDGSEPLGPGSSEYKAADAIGTSGISTGVMEYELTLQLSLKLKSVLETQGYTVILTRESSDVAVSCVQRAETANNAGADAYIRIHANGSDDSSAQGAMTICITPQNPYIAEQYQSSHALSEAIVNNLSNSTGCENDGVWETDSMSGNNWSKVPTTIVEVGYMTNPQEDVLLATDDYQNQVVQGIAAGVGQYLGM